MGAEAERSGSAPRLAVAEDADALRELFREYAEGLGDHAAYLGGFDDEVERLPAGFELVLLVDGAGCVAVRRLDDIACEMKRLYVRPSARGTGLGRALVMAAIERACERGYSIMRLDTLPSMVAAPALYESLGFVEVERYNDNQAPGVRFMELVLPPR